MDRRAPKDASKALVALEESLMGHWAFVRLELLRAGSPVGQPMLALRAGQVRP